MNEEGYIYVLGVAGGNNIALCKIGMTTKEPELRCKQINQGSTGDVLWEVVYKEFVKNRRECESLVHTKLTKYRQSGKEIFHIRPDEVIPIVRACQSSVNLTPQVFYKYPSNKECINKLVQQVKDYATTHSQKIKAIKNMGLLCRHTEDKDKIKRNAKIIVELLSNKNKEIRDLSETILIDIGVIAIDVVLEKEIYSIPGRRHGYDIKKSIFIGMGKVAVEELVQRIDKDIYVITEALCGMPFDNDSIKRGCINLFLKENMMNRYREEIFKNMQKKNIFTKNELQAVIQKGLNHTDPLVRVLSAEWHISTNHIMGTINILLKDNAIVDRFYSQNFHLLIHNEIKNKPVFYWVKEAIKMKKEIRGQKR